MRGSRRVDYWSTPCGIMLRDRRLEDERSEVAKLFRLRLRIPFLLFRDVLLPTFREKNILPEGNHLVRVPLEFTQGSLHLMSKDSYNFVGVAISSLTLE